MRKSWIYFLLALCLLIPCLGQAWDVIPPKYPGGYSGPGTSTPNMYNGSDTLRPGNVVLLGSYPMTRRSGYVDIEWIVLDVRDDVALIISHFGIDAGYFHNSKTNITWEKSDIRDWLNTVFFYNAFSESERSTICMTHVDNSWNQGSRKYDTDGGNDTYDRIFLLSYQEVARYFRGNESRKLISTDYARYRGAHVRNQETADQYFDGDGVGYSYWWLRSPANAQYRMYYVNASGEFDWGDVSNTTGSIRPAMWVTWR